MTYSNAILYGASLPTYSSTKEGRKDGQKTGEIKADDPKNRDEVHKLIAQMK